MFFSGKQMIQYLVVFHLYFHTLIDLVLEIYIKKRSPSQPQSYRTAMSPQSFKNNASNSQAIVIQGVFNKSTQGYCFFFSESINKAKTY